MQVVYQTVYICTSNGVIVFGNKNALFLHNIPHLTVVFVQEESLHQRKLK